MMYNIYCVIQVANFDSQDILLDLLGSCLSQWEQSLLLAF